MPIRLAESDAEIDRCYPVMAQLRPQFARDAFVAQVRRQMQQDRFRLVYLEEDGAVAGFREGEMLHRGRYVYVDDLVTDADSRSRGHGGQLFDWLVAYARAAGCQQLHLDSGVQRAGAHRFYFAKRMHVSSFHFLLRLDEG
jgi:GNAT superfamily N-acetyltransferase